MTMLRVAVGALGWIGPGLVSLPIAAAHESAGGESALGAVIVWWVLATLGCAIAGILLGLGPLPARDREGRFWAGLAGVSLAWIAAIAVSIAIEAIVKVLHLGPLAFLIPVPFVLAYGAGFGLAALFTRGGE
jgi:hypothetical protein